MRLLKQIFNFYINSSIHVALSVYSLTWITLIEYHMLYDKTVLYFIFYASITGYNFVKYFGVAKFHHRSLASWLKAIQVFSFLCFFAMCYYGFQLHKTTITYVLIFGVITFFYAIPFLPTRFFLDNQKNLRSIGGLKVYLIALVWVGVTVFIPIINNHHYINTDELIIAAQRYLFVVVLMLPFEIRDLRYDNLKLSTIPQKIGIKQTKFIGLLLLFLFYFLEFFKDELTIANSFLILVVAIITGLFLIFSKVEQSKYYSSFWVEALPILWLVMLLF